MLLSELIAGSADRAPDLGWDIGPQGGDPTIAGLKLDSRRVQTGDLFFCLPGDTTNGHSFAGSAASAGAVAIVVDHWLDVPLAQVRVRDVRRAMPHISNMFFGDPSLDLRVVGVTGTNGKTTTAHLVKAVLDHAGLPCGLLGTLSGARTTPESPHLQASLRTMLDDGMRAVAIEVSSHALVQDRVTGMDIDVGVFTNLSPDHLDYHGTIDAYFDAKAILFRTGLLQAAVINTDDPRGAVLLESLDIPAAAYSHTIPEHVKTTMSGSEFTWRGHRVRLALPGLFNMENAVAAAEAVRFLGIDDASIAGGLSAAGQVAGRFEVVVSGDETVATVIVDYSHTPAGIDQVLRSVHEIDPDAVVCIVFGAGGDRDRDKRPLMGAAAVAGADHVIVTSDNPRSEMPQTIVDDILSGINDVKGVQVELDRRSAIAMALESHGASDVIVVAGKGHERTQTIGNEVFDFDDRAVVRELVAGGAS